VRILGFGGRIQGALGVGENAAKLNHGPLRLARLHEIAAGS